MRAETLSPKIREPAPTAANGDFGPPPGLFLIGKREIGASDPGFSQVVQGAHGSRLRPRCLCRPEGVEMYIARYRHDFIVKRMPDTGHCHGIECRSYEPPASWSGLAPLLGQAIREDLRTGETQLQVDFALSQRVERHGNSDASCDEGDSTPKGNTSSKRMSLGCLLQYLWDQAELTRWKAAFAGRRSWATVRRLLLQAAEHKQVRGQALPTHLFIPESFSVEQRDEIEARRLAQWNGVRSARRPRPLMLLIAELKELMPARFGFTAVVKHMPDQALLLPESLFRRVEQRFQKELTLWSSSPELRLVMIGTFWVSEAGVATLDSLSLMPVTPQWLPFEDLPELHLVHELLSEGRAFIKAQRYRLPPTAPSASAILTDTRGAPIPLYIERAKSQEETSAMASAGTGSTELPNSWCWHLNSEPMPKLPAANASFRAG